MKLGALRKLVLIHSGVYDYAEIDLLGSVHLAGDNNTGKTSLINCFQFLYVDDWTLMKFKDDNASTRKHFFPEHSYILFEVDAPSGIKMIGFRGLGPQGKEAYERFVVNGAYEKEMFFDGERQRDWEDIAQNFLAPRVVKPQTKLVLDRKELRCAMLGEGESAGVRLNLIPASNHLAFVKIFMNLMAMRETTDEDLRELILDTLNRDEIELRELDLARDFDQLSRGIQAHGVSLKVLEANEEEARALATDHQVMLDLAGALPGEWVRLNESLHQGIVKLREQGETLETLIEQGAQQGTVLTRGLNEINEEIRKVTKEKDRATWEIERIDKLANEQIGLTGEALADKVRQLESALEPLVGQRAVLENPGSRKDLEDRLKRLVDDRARKQAVLDNPKASWAEMVLGECDEGQRANVLRLIHPGVMALPAGPQGVVLKDEAALFREINDLDRRIKDGFYEDAAVRVNLSAIPVPKVGVFDPVEIQREIEAMDADATRLRGLLEGVSSLESLDREIKGLRAQRAAAEVNLNAFLAWRKEEEERPNLVQQATDAAQRLARLEGEKREKVAELAELHDLQEERGRLLEGYVAQRKKLTVELESHSLQSDPTWDLPDPAAVGELLDPEATLAALGPYRSRFKDANDKFVTVQRGMVMMQNALGSLLHGADLPDCMKNLGELMDSLPDRREALRKEKRALVEQAVRRFTDFYKGFLAVKHWCHRTTRALAEVQVSNLKSIRILLQPTEAATTIEQLTSADGPMFDADHLDEAVSRIVERMEEKKVFALRDLFDLQIEVTRASGDVKVYRKLSGESTGTAMTFKVVLMSMMLRGLSKAQTNIRIRLPLFVDEVTTLDDANRNTVLRTAERLGFNVLMASPSAVPAHRVYFMHKVDYGNGERTRITPEDEYLAMELEAEAEAERLGEAGGEALEKRDGEAV